jgi:hypothetical protein
MQVPGKTQNFKAVEAGCGFVGGVLFKMVSKLSAWFLKNEISL